MEPTANQVVLDMHQGFSTSSGSLQGCGFSQSAGAMRERPKISSETPKYAVAI